MPGMRNFSLSIRKKAVIGLTVSLVAVVFIGTFSYRNLSLIKTKQHVVEIADDLINTVLEMRRYEKNYLLYSSLKDLEENHFFLEQVKQILSGISPEIGRLSIAPELNLIGQELNTYKDALNRMDSCRDQDRALCRQLEEHMRESGRKVEELSQLLVSVERKRILDLLSTLERNLILALSILVAVGMLVTFLVGFKIVLPLRTIEKTTMRIAQGDFSLLTVPSSRDETQRVMEAFNRMIKELEKRQEQLVQAKKLSSIGILASGIAHQLNNPLNNVSTSIQIIAEEFEKGDPAFLRRLLDNCGQEILRTQEIVKGLLEFARQKEFALRRVRLQDVVERALRLISSQVPPGIDIQTEVPDDIYLDLDSQRIQEVILNLVMNAIQAIEDGIGRIRILAKNTTDAKGRPMVEIQITDTGKGIDPQDVGRIFDPFFTTKEVGAGTGLGLSIVYGIVHQHNGSITVDSRPNEGTRFTIHLLATQPADQNKDARP